jgi:hypothetical protein
LAPTSVDGSECPTRTMTAVQRRSRLSRRRIGETDVGVGFWIGAGIVIALSIGFRVAKSMIDLRTHANKDWLKSDMDGRFNRGKKPFDPTKL